jgi:hypothetical protein
MNPYDFRECRNLCATYEGAHKLHTNVSGLFREGVTGEARASDTFANKSSAKLA